MCFSKPLITPSKEESAAWWLSCGRSSTRFQWHWGLLPLGAPSCWGEVGNQVSQEAPFVMSLLGGRRRLMTTFTWSTYPVEGGSITTGLLLRSIIAGGWEPRLPASQTQGEGGLFRVCWGWSLCSPCGLWWQGWWWTSFSSGFGWSRVIML